MNLSATIALGVVACGIGFPALHIISQRQSPPTKSDIAAMIVYGATFGAATGALPTILGIAAVGITGSYLYNASTADVHAHLAMIDACLQRYPDVNTGVTYCKTKVESYLR